MQWIILASVVVAAAGFGVLHFARARRTAEIMVAGWVLVIGAITSVVSIFYFPPPAPMLAYSPMMGGYSMPGKQCHRKWASEEGKPEAKTPEKMTLEAPPPPASEADPAPAPKKNARPHAAEKMAD